MNIFFFVFIPAFKPFLLVKTYKKHHDEKKKKKREGGSICLGISRGQNDLV